MKSQFLNGGGGSFRLRPSMTGISRRKKKSLIAYDSFAESISFSLSFASSCKVFSKIVK